MECGEWAKILLENHNILVHPGSFYGMEGGPYLVLSLLPEKNIFREGISLVLEEVSRRAGA
jgi:aspartate/methionine/tyrosine aminotransferase